MRCNHLIVDNVKVNVTCTSTLSDCEVAYDKMCQGCEYLETHISYEVHR